MAAERRAVILGPHDRAAAVEAKSRDPERRRTLAGTDGSNTLVIEPAYDDSWAVPLAPWWFAEYVPMRRDVWGRALESWQPGELTRVHAATGPLWEHLVGGRLTADGDPAVPYGTTAVVSHRDAAVPGLQPRLQGALALQLVWGRAPALQHRLGRPHCAHPAVLRR